MASAIECLAKLDAQSSKHVVINNLSITGALTRFSHDQKWERTLNYALQCTAAMA